MKNLKKVLCLTLVFAMAFGLMISASATTFSDKDSIKNTDAVALLDSLNIMSGNADGTFDPDGNLTRAQIAKMIYVARTGGVDDQAVLYKGTSNTFSDTKGHWAEGYINYAAAKGFVAGRGNGKYDPNATITGYELLKIALCALGYDAEVEGFVGGSWKANVAALAQEAGLTENVTTDPAVPITRDSAAQVFANLVYSTTIRYTDGAAYKYTSKNDDPYTFGEVYLSLSQVTGVMLSNDHASIATTPNALGTGLIGVDVDKSKDIEASKNETFNVGKYNIDIPENYLGQSVTVLYRLKNGTVSNIYGVNATKELNKVTEINWGTMASFTESNMNGAKIYENYKEAAAYDKNNPFTTRNYYKNSVATGMDFKAANDATQYNLYSILACLRAVPTRCVDNNGDGVYDYIFETTLELAKVTSAIGGTIVLSPYNGSAATVPNLTSKNATGIDKLAKNDIVAYRQYGNSYIVNKCDSFEGTVNSFTYDDKSGTYDVTLDGVKYNTASGVNGTYGNKIVSDTPIGEKNTYYTVGGKLVYKGAATEVIPNYALVKKAAQDSLGSDWRVAVLLDTGVSGTYKVSTLDSKSTQKYLDDNLAALNGTAGTERIYQYTLNDDGTISLKVPANYEINGTLSADYKLSQSSLVGNYYVSSSTVAFIKSSSDSNYYVYKGIGSIPAIKAPTSIQYVGGKELSKPMYYTNCVYFTSAEFAPTESKDYYLVTSTPTIVDSTGNFQFTAYLGDEVVTLKAIPDLYYTYTNKYGQTQQACRIQKNGIYNFDFNEKGYVKAIHSKPDSLYKEGYAIDGSGASTLILSTIDNPGATVGSKNGTAVYVYSVDSSTIYYYFDTTAGTVVKADKDQLSVATYSNDEIVNDVNTTFVDRAFGNKIAKTQVKVIENDSDSAIDVVYIFSTPQDSLDIVK